MKLNLKERAKQLKTDIPAVFIAMKKRETPVLAKILGGATVLYVLSPIDLIPDFIPVLGYLDDLILLPLLVAAIVKLIPKDVFAQCRKESEGLWADGNRKNGITRCPLWQCGCSLFLSW